MTTRMIAKTLSPAVACGTLADARAARMNVTTTTTPHSPSWAASPRPRPERNPETCPNPKYAITIADATIAPLRTSRRTSPRTGGQSRGSDDGARHRRGRVDREEPGRGSRNRGTGPRTRRTGPGAAGSASAGRPGTITDKHQRMVRREQEARGRRMTRRPAGRSRVMSRGTNSRSACAPRRCRCPMCRGRPARPSARR